MFLTIKNIPKVSWSSEKPLNVKPKISTFLFLCFGLTLFGLGEGLLIVSFTGASPWSVLAQGISLNIDLSIGTITLFLSIENSLFIKIPELIAEAPALVPPGLAAPASSEKTKWSKY